ncbi:histidine kinase [Fulvivirga maritima]|uniref:sensor histidine kinase n=1 Tax=Fulvivirga maritima TaxID=2904247 RepID=UPI001F2D0E07|nr:histidine kinase [Fulvivirga maritima]UII24996.1 histidine kinase [Fulvivirga maritima]
MEKREAERLFEEEVVKTHVEIKEQALKNFGWELHDNVGQILSTARMQLNLLSLKVPADLQGSLDEVGELIGASLSQIRLLSKTLNPETIKRLGLVEAIRLEMDRFNRLQFLEATFTIQGEEEELGERETVILFRIMQEYFSNVIRHAKATQLNVSLKYSKGTLTISASDNGIGFGADSLNNGTGLLNMRSRAKLIGAEYSMKSQKKEGAQMMLKYKI